MGMAMVLVAETLSSRNGLAQQIMVSAILTQSILVVLAFAIAYICSNVCSSRCVNFLA